MIFAHIVLRVCTYFGHLHTRMICSKGLALLNWYTEIFVQEFVDLLAFVVPDCRGEFHVWETFLYNFLGIDSNACFTPWHFCLISISAKYGHHSWISYPKYCRGQYSDHIFAISKIANKGVATIAYAKSVEYLHNNERNDTVGADGVAKEWTGPTKGCYTKAVLKGWFRYVFCLFVLC